ncbi:MAG: DNA methyltransferase, partial [Acidimicrobiia bacterium]
MSRLTELLRQARKADPQLGADLEAEISALTKRRTFGLVFEQHQPEAVELPGRAVRRGDKVRVLPPRGETKTGDQRLWRVTRMERADGQRVARLVELDAEEPDPQAVLAGDLVVVAEFRDRIHPGLIETGRVERGGDKPFHTVINAENYHALEMLTYTHRHSIDTIYIDPPYNTGAKDWKYNNNYVESDDDYRHSKWLAMMERRLEVARELLNPDDSVLIVTIDEKEVNRLGLLLHQLFPESGVQLVTTVINRKGNARRGEFSRCEEYLYILRFGEAALSGWHHDMLHSSKEAGSQANVRWKSLLRLASTGQTSGRFNLFYPLFFDAVNGRFLRTGAPLGASDSVEDVEVPNDETVLWPISRDGTDGRWSIGVDKFNDYMAKGYVRFGRRNAGGRTPYYLMDSQILAIESGDLAVVGRDEDGAVILEVVARRKQPMSVWNVPSHSTSGAGTSVVRSLLPDR